MLMTFMMTIDVCTFVFILISFFFSVSWPIGWIYLWWLYVCLLLVFVAFALLHHFIYVCGIDLWVYFVIIQAKKMTPFALLQKYQKYVCLKTRLWKLNTSYNNKLCAFSICPPSDYVHVCVCIGLSFIIFSNNKNAIKNVDTTT